MSAPGLIRDVLRSLRDSDRRDAPPFERLIARTRKAPRLHRMWWPAGAAVAATVLGLALWLRPPISTQTPPAAWSDWRSPTAALLFDGSVVMELDGFVSPTRALTRSPQSSAGEVR